MLVSTSRCLWRRLLLSAVSIVMVFIAAFPALAAGERWFVEVTYRNEADIRRLGAHFQHLRVDRGRGMVMLDANAAQLKFIQDSGLEVRIDLAATARMSRAMHARSKLHGIPGYECYRTVEETDATIDKIIAEHPNLAHAVEIGDSWERTHSPPSGYRLRVVVLSNHATASPKPALFAMTAIHAREYTTAELSTRFAEWLVNNYGSDPDATWLLDHNEFHLLLQSNPDGRKRAEGALFWRKNTNDVTANCIANPDDSGVDLNRNYPFMWGAEPAGSSSFACDETFRGISAGSEPETQAVVDYVTALFPDRRADDTTTPAPPDYEGLVIDIHSYSQLVLWPWGFDSPAPNMPALRTLGRRLAWFNGYLPEQSKDLYPADGTANDTFYGRLGVPAYTIEIGTDFFEDCSDFEHDTYPKNIAALRYAARTLHAPYVLPAGPDARDVAIESDLVAIGHPIRVRALVDDSHFSTRNGTEPTQAIASAAAYVDALPWQTDAVAIPLDAADGAFDATTENVAGYIDSGELLPGKHLVYVQGTDANGMKGPPSADFVEVDVPQNIATLTGRITAALDDQPLAAKVRITTADRSYIGQADIDGNYTRTARAGTITAVANAPGYIEESAAGIALTSGTATTHDFTLLPRCTTFIDNVESGNADWTAQPRWGITNTVSGNTTHVWTDSPAGSYGANRDSSLTSRVFDFSNDAAIELTFAHKCRTGAGYDVGRIEISTDAAQTQWSEIYRCSGKNAWERVSLPLTAATGKSGVKLRFRFTSDAGGSDEGWSIDDIRLSHGGDSCRATYLSDTIFANGFEN